jgi:hypothetical protein
MAPVAATADTVLMKSRREWVIALVRVSAICWYVDVLRQSG